MYFNLVLEEIGVETFTDRYSYFTSENNPTIKSLLHSVCFQGGYLARSEVGIYCGRLVSDVKYEYLSTKVSTPISSSTSLKCAAILCFLFIT